MNEVPPPDDFSEKEVYAYFGAAAYHAQVLEKGLVNMVAAFSTLGLPITRSEFDAIFAAHNSKAIGPLLKTAKKHQIPISDEVSELLDHARNQRNYLNHEFFADHAGHWSTVDGRRAMIERLSELIRLFQAADSASEQINNPLMQRMGVTPERVEQEKQRIIARATTPANA